MYSFIWDEMSLSLVVSVSLALFVLLGVKISGLQECSLATVMCTENNKAQAINNYELLHGNFSWKCTRQSLQIDLSCKASQQKNATRLCCEVSVQKENNRLTRRSASCTGIVRTKKVIKDHNQDQDQILNCEWEWSALNISLQTTISLQPGTYYHCSALQSNSSLQTSNATLSTTLTPTALTSAKWTTGSSAINETLTTLGETLLKSVQTSRNCSATLIQEILMKIEKIVREFLSGLLNTTATVQSSFVNEFIALYGIITAKANKPLTVPDPLEEQRSQGTFSLPRGSIDIGEGRLGIVTVVFKFSALCNDTQALEMNSADTNRSSLLQSPIVSVLAMTKNGSVGALQRNATLKFRIKRPKGSSVRCMFLNHTSSNKSSWSDNGMTFLDNDEDNFTTCWTDHLTSFAVLIDYSKDNEKIQLSNTEKQVLDLITKTGSGLAILCLVACIFTFARVRGLSAMRYRIHLNLCAALAAAQLVFVTGIDATEIKGVCVAVAVMLHYFFTASFTWMLVEAIHLFLKIVSVFNIRITRMRYYVAIGWGIPVLIVAISVSAHHEGYGTPKLCWLSLDGGLIWAFFIPVVIVVSINVFVLVAIIVVRVSLKGNPLSPSENKRFVAAFKTVIVLFPLLGLCWFFGIVGVMTKSRPFIYAFVVLSSLQGFFILVFHCIGNTEVRGSLKALKDRHSLESSIRQEQKKRLRESRTEQKISSSTRDNPAGKKNLIKQVSGLKQSRKQREKATSV